MSKPLMRDKALYIFFVVLCTQKYQSTQKYQILRSLRKANEDGYVFVFTFGIERCHRLF